MFANVTSSLTEQQLQSDLCARNSVRGENLFGCFYSLKTTQSMEKEYRVQRDAESSWAGVPAMVWMKGPLLKGTCILGTNSSRRSEQEQMRLFKKGKKNGKSERVWGVLMAAEFFMQLLHVSNKAR